MKAVLEILDPGSIVVKEEIVPETVQINESKTDVIVIREGPKGEQGPPGTMTWETAQW